MPATLLTQLTLSKILEALKKPLQILQPYPRKRTQGGGMAVILNFMVHLEYQYNLDFLTLRENLPSILKLI